MLFSPSIVVRPCCHRALLSDTAILVLDEATANVDKTTDALIQRSLRLLISQSKKTILIVAHRIDTIMDCDVLLVLNNGELVEHGSPAELVGREQGFFNTMVQSTKYS